MTPTPATTSPKTATAKPAAASKTAAPAKLGKYLDTDTIEVLVDANPKKIGSASRARFALYGGGKGHKTTVGEFLKAGGHRIDLPWDSAPTRKFIAIRRAGSPVA